MARISITNGDHAKIKGLPVAATYEVEEEDYRSEGYRVYDASNESGTLTRDTSNVSYTNIKTIAIPTQRTIAIWGTLYLAIFLLSLCYPAMRKKSSSRKEDE